MRQLADALLFSGAWMACCAGALVAETYLLSDLPVNWRWVLFATSGTWCVYSAHALLRLGRYAAYGTTPRHQWMLNHRNSLPWLSCFVLLAAAAAFDYHKWRLLLRGLPLLLLTVGYSVPVVRVQGRWQPLRNLPLLKVLLIALVWAAVTAALPLLEKSLPLTQPPHSWLLLRRFLFILALALLFDIRDLYRDRQGGTLTVPALLGVAGAKAVAWLALAVFAGLAWLQADWTSTPLLLSAGLSAAVVAGAAPGRHDYYYSFLADGMLLLQALLVWGWR